MSTHDKDKRPHGATGDTVQQAADVSRPTAPRDPELDDAGAARVPPGSRTGSDSRQSAGDGAGTGGLGGPDTGSDAMPGRSNAL